MALAKSLWTTIVDLVSTGQNVSDNLDTAFTNIDTAIAQVDTNTAAIAGKVAKLDVGMLVGHATALASQALTIAYSKVDVIGTIELDLANSHLSYDAVTNKRITVATAGIYDIGVFGSLEAPNTSEVTFSYYLNGVQSGHEQVFVGKGVGKPVVFQDHIVIQLAATDYLEIFAKGDSSFNLDIIESHSSIEKTHF